MVDGRDGGIYILEIRQPDGFPSICGIINNENYLSNLCSQIHPTFVGMFLVRNAIIQDAYAEVLTAKTVIEWHGQHSSALEKHIWVPQSLDVNIIENLCCILDKTIKGSIPPASLEEVKIV